MRDDLTARAVRAACTLRNWAATGHEPELFPSGAALGETPEIIIFTDCADHLGDLALSVGAGCDLAWVPYDYDSEGHSSQATAEAIRDIGELVLELVRRLEAHARRLDAAEAEIRALAAEVDRLRSALSHRDTP
jgi:hypothetical protein